jgi:hypothetical protein
MLLMRADAACIGTARPLAIDTNVTREGHTT